MFMYFKISNQQKVNVLGSLIPIAYVILFFSQMSIGSDSDLSENDKDPYKQSVKENEIDICEEILKDVDNILNEFPDASEFNFPADTSRFDFDPNSINQSIFPAQTSVEQDLNANPISQCPADVSNDNSISTQSNNLPLRESTN